MKYNRGIPENQFFVVYPYNFQIHHHGSSDISGCKTYFQISIHKKAAGFVENSVFVPGMASRISSHAKHNNYSKRNKRNLFYKRHDHRPPLLWFLLLFIHILTRLFLIVNLFIYFFIIFCFIIEYKKTEPFTGFCFLRFISLQL